MPPLGARIADDQSSNRFSGSAPRTCNVEWQCNPPMFRNHAAGKTDRKCCKSGLMLLANTDNTYNTFNTFNTYNTYIITDREPQFDTGFLSLAFMALYSLYCIKYRKYSLSLRGTCDTKKSKNDSERVLALREHPPDYVYV
mmetsp:Transcript_24746/g.68278  ORF Transcript_24746/g.68278 Transcript_24746/m.68278 type:complete len:141 (+) Transcript_24746:127-549(+)